MTIDQIRNKLLDKIVIDHNWMDKLNDTDPGHYGIEDWEVQLTKDDIWIDIPNGTFTFKKAKFDFEIVLGSSNDGTQMEFSKVANGQGTFNFSPNGQDIMISELQIEIDLSLFDDK